MVFRTSSEMGETSEFTTEETAQLGTSQIDGESLLSDEKSFDELHSLFEVPNGCRGQVVTRVFPSRQRVAAERVEDWTAGPAVRTALAQEISAGKKGIDFEAFAKHVRKAKGRPCWWFLPPPR